MESFITETSEEEEEESLSSTSRTCTDNHTVPEWWQRPTIRSSAQKMCTGRVSSQHLCSSHMQQSRRRWWWRHIACYSRVATRTFLLQAQQYHKLAHSYSNDQYYDVEEEEEQD